MRILISGKCQSPTCDRNAVLRCDGFVVCKMHYGRIKKGWSIDREPLVRDPVCNVDGCDKKNSTKGMCMMHYSRLKRTGSLDPPVYGKKRLTDNGYVAIFAKGHPVALKTGTAYEHRKILYDRIGGGVHQCYWCGSPIEWMAKGQRKLVVDHLDSDKQNNSQENLAQSCHPCNSMRGLVMSWVTKHRDDPFLMRVMNAANDNRTIRCEAA